jgi:hypothetical protein
MHGTPTPRNWRTMVNLSIWMWVSQTILSMLNNFEGGNDLKTLGFKVQGLRF